MATPDEPEKTLAMMEAAANELQINVELEVEPTSDTVRSFVWNWAFVSFFFVPVFFSLFFVWFCGWHEPFAVLSMVLVVYQLTWALNLIVQLLDRVLSVVKDAETTLDYESLISFFKEAKQILTARYKKVYVGQSAFVRESLNISGPRKTRSRGKVQETKDTGARDVCVEITSYPNGAEGVEEEQGQDNGVAGKEGEEGKEETKKEGEQQASKDNAEAKKRQRQIQKKRRERRRKKEEEELDAEEDEDFFEDGLYAEEPGKKREKKEGEDGAAVGVVVEGEANAGEEVAKVAPKRGGRRKKTIEETLGATPASTTVSSSSSSRKRGRRQEEDDDAEFAPSSARRNPRRGKKEQEQEGEGQEEEGEEDNKEAEEGGGGGGEEQAGVGAEEEGVSLSANRARRNPKPKKTPGGGRRGKRKSNAPFASTFDQDMSVMLNSPDSCLINGPLRGVLSFENFEAMVPPEEKDKLLELLPAVDKTSLDSVRRLFTSNDYFRSSIREFQEGLAAGVFDSSLDFRVYQISQKKRQQAAPDWKTKHFENYYGEKQRFAPAPPPDFGPAFSFVVHEKDAPRVYPEVQVVAPPPDLAHAPSDGDLFSLEALVAAGTRFPCQICESLHNSEYNANRHRRATHGVFFINEFPFVSVVDVNKAVAALSFCIGADVVDEIFGCEESIEELFKEISFE